jgi:hypothetical protein
MGRPDAYRVFPFADIVFVNLIGTPLRSSDEITDGAFDHFAFRILDHKRHVDGITSRGEVHPARFLFVHRFPHRGVAIGRAEKQECGVNVHRPSLDRDDRLVFLAALGAGDQFEVSPIETNGRFKIDASLLKVDHHARQLHRLAHRLLCRRFVGRVLIREQRQDDREHRCFCSSFHWIF